MPYFPYFKRLTPVSASVVLFYNFLADEETVNFNKDLELCVDYIGFKKQCFESLNKMYRKSIKY